tara:strand:+ start:757 stop:939 length:183 start_codon:yes stop_codon:yes gene_type:complete
MLAFLTGMIVGVPISLVSIKMMSNLEDVSTEMVTLNEKLDSLIIRMDRQAVERSKFEGRN